MYCADYDSDILKTDSAEGTDRMMLLQQQFDIAETMKDVNLSAHLDENNDFIRILQLKSQGKYQQAKSILCGILSQGKLEGDLRTALTKKYCELVELHQSQLSSEVLIKCYGTN